jgi:hypothetical protein
MHRERRKEYKDLDWGLAGKYTTFVIRWEHDIKTDI